MYSKEKRVINILAENLSTLNSDIHLTRQMPKILPGEKGVETFIEALKLGGLKDLASLIDVVHSGKKILREKRCFANRQERYRFSNYCLILDDMAIAIRDNIDLLDRNMTVPKGYYRGDETRVGELVLTFYDLILERLDTDKESTRTANQRAESLFQVPGFVRSPLMRRVMENENASISEPI